MQININGKPAESSDNITIVELLKEQKVEAPEYVSVELNGEILDRQDFASTVVSPGDQLEFLYYMGGGR
jgi:sulfur carrier protein